MGSHFSPKGSNPQQEPGGLKPCDHTPWSFHRLHTNLSVFLCTKTELQRELEHLSPGPYGSNSFLAAEECRLMVYLFFFTLCLAVGVITRRLL